MSEPSSEPSSEPVSRGSRRRQRVWLTVGLVLVLAAGTTAVLVARAGSAEPDARRAVGETHTVDRGDIVQEARATGRLGYRGSTEVVVSLAGTVTRTPRTKASLRRNDVLARVDDRPVVLLYGRLPVWRELAAGVADGADVGQLERNLVALGYLDVVPDDHFTSVTARAVEDWQEDLGLEPTGRVEQGRVVFMPGPVRVLEHTLVRGGAAAGGQVSLAQDQQQAIIDVEADLAAAMELGEKVTLALPDGTTVRGRILARGLPTEQDTESGGTKIVVAMTVAIPPRRQDDRHDQVRVTARLDRVLARDVLRLPVTALIALPGGDAGGGVGVERVDGDRVDLVPVELGVTAAGMVEVRGGALAPGDRVVVGR